MITSRHQSKTLYHGSPVLFAKIDLEKGRPRKDFGRGFYLAVSKSQALKVMRKKFRETVERRPNHSKDGLIKTLYTFDVDETRLAELKVKVFSQADAEWFDFVLECRRNDKTPHDYDVVIGPTADDDTKMVIKSLLDGLYGDWWTKKAKDTALAALHPERLGVQWCLLTPRAVSTLVKKMEVERYD